MSIALSPLYFFSILPEYIRIITNLINQQTSNGFDYNSIIDLYSKMWIVLGLGTWIGGVANSFIYPAFKTLFYIDLQYRKNEFDKLQVPEEPKAPITTEGTDSTNIQKDLL